MTVPARRKREPRCPCGSGKPRSSCEPDVVLVPCQAEGCDQLFHMRSNAARYCERCRVDREKLHALERQRRRRRRLRGPSVKRAPKRPAELVPDQLALELAA